MNSVCESHNHAGGKDRHAVGGNCVAARRGGEQPETEDWSRTKVNSIRQVQRASLLGKGEACRASGESVPVQGLPKLETGRCKCGWSGNDLKGPWDKWRDRPGCQERSPAGVRASIVAKKPGNAGGAKGRRKTKYTKTDYWNIHSAYCPTANTRRTKSHQCPTRCIGEQPGDGFIGETLRQANCESFFSLAMVHSERSLLWKVIRQSESRMREIRPSGSAGGAEQFNAPSLPRSSVMKLGRYLCV